jgi:hypothetical protein
MIGGMLILLLFYFGGIGPKVLVDDVIVVHPISHVALELLALEVDGRNHLLDMLSWF